ncbi:50S ribosomal protein L25 [Blochmannia endosymbiont of Camponotus modoc]|uniref:50S ribosomal protein L25 n=1 Tax=Blochmannia endosymbiont of Camponotus modoc TaxID=2945587 RepID=UPI00202428C4|nr:50S ribosomal protein L25 [Blochmannia endosymbiont of Camponotus modoc]URJ26325.1 50S ribosomal protein L25 [Blochmannia endosymbiont of Camponotus modoc]URJ31636.1 50S ribosomal protein L25 [Blochmannia endosymbiont of Camponotus modoc]
MLTIKANLRIYHKKGATRRLRKQNKCPAIIYNRGQEPSVPIVLNQNDILHPEAVIQLYKNNVILLFIENQQTITVKVQELQYHPFKAKLIHIDFTRV